MTATAPAAARASALEIDPVTLRAQAVGPDARDVVDRCRTVPEARPLLDFALQYLGNVRFEGGDGAAEPVASTRLALDTVTRARAIGGAADPGGTA